MVEDRGTEISKEIAARLILEGKYTDEEIAERSGYPLSKISSFRAFINSPNGLKWLKRKGIIDDEEYERRMSKYKAKKKVEEEKEEEEKIEDAYVTKEGMDIIDVSKLSLEVPSEEEVPVIASQIARKVVLNPKVLLLYDWIKARFGYDGDLSDFILDVIEDFMRSRNLKIMIVREIPNRRR